MWCSPVLKVIQTIPPALILSLCTMTNSLMTPLVFLLHLQSIYIAKENTNYHPDFLSSVEKRYSKLERTSSSSNDSFPGGPAPINEIQTIIRNLKRRKAPGFDFFQNDYLIHGGKHLARFITHLFNAILEVEYVLSVGKETSLCPSIKATTNLEILPIATYQLLSSLARFRCLKS